MRSLWGMVRVDRPKKVRLVNGGLDRSPGRGVAGWQVLLCGWGGAALAGEVCCHWSRGSERLLPLGTSIRREEGRPIMVPGSGLTCVCVSNQYIYTLNLHNYLSIISQARKINK